MFKYLIFYVSILENLKLKNSRCEMWKMSNSQILLSLKKKLKFALQTLKGVKYTKKEFF